MTQTEIIIIGIVVGQTIVLAGWVTYLLWCTRKNKKDISQLMLVMTQREELYRKDQLAQALHREYIVGLVEKLSKEFDDAQMAIECRFNTLENKEET